MTTIRTTCDRCGDVELTTTDVTLEKILGLEAGRYRFECPICRVTIRRPANHRVFKILEALDVNIEKLFDHVNCRSVLTYEAPITEDEIVTFRIGLDAGDEWMEEILPNYQVTPPREEQQ